jgi:hypothetical protein
MDNRGLTSSNELRRPSQVSSQLSMFPRRRDETLSLLRVSLDDAAHWQQLGWLSYDAAALAMLEDNQIAELVFIRDIARSGLPYSLVTDLLGELERPYAYPPETTAYSFSSGWVEVLFPDMDQMVDQHLENWVQEKLAQGDEERLSAASDSIMLALAELRVRNKLR